MILEFNVVIFGVRGGYDLNMVINVLFLKRVTIYLNLRCGVFLMRFGFI